MTLPTPEQARAAMERVRDIRRYTKTEAKRLKIADFHKDAAALDLLLALLDASAKALGPLEDEAAELEEWADSALLVSAGVPALTVGHAREAKRVRDLLGEGK